MDFGNFPSRLSSAKQQREMMKSEVCGERQHTTVNFSIFFSTLNAVPTNLVWLYCSSSTNWNNRNKVQLTETYIIK